MQALFRIGIFIERKKGKVVNCLMLKMRSKMYAASSLIVQEIALEIRVL